MEDAEEAEAIVSGPGNSVLDALLESLAGLKVSFGETPDSFGGDREQTADARELSVSDLLTSYFPTTWTVKKGPIYDAVGGKSNSIDSVLCTPDHPPMRTPRRGVILADAVHSATETKPDLRTHTASSELHRGLMQIASVKRLVRELDPAVFPAAIRQHPERHRIPCALFTARLGDVDSAIEYMHGVTERGELQPVELPDLLIALDGGVIYHAADVSTSLFRSIAATQDITSGEIYLVLPAEDHYVLAWYLALLYRFVSPEPYLRPPILQKYLLTLPFPADHRLFRVT